jgi:uncharacterized protein
MITVRAKVLTPRLIKSIRNQFRLDWNGSHGVAHWSRVRLNGITLAKATGADPVVVELFAFLHDSCRQTDGHDNMHGARAAEFVGTLQGREIYLNESQLATLQHACRDHTHGGISNDPTIATCWDADRLDLGRVGIEPDPEYLCTAAAKNPAIMEWAYRRSVA